MSSFDIFQRRRPKSGTSTALARLTLTGASTNDVAISVGDSGCASGHSSDDAAGVGSCTHGFLKAEAAVERSGLSMAGTCWVGGGNGRVNIELHIERLILDGFSLTRNEGGLVQQAVEAELARLLAGAGLSPTLKAGAAPAYALGGVTQLGSGINPTDLGQQIAQSVYRGLGNE